MTSATPCKSCPQDLLDDNRLDIFLWGRLLNACDGNPRDLASKHVSDMLETGLVERHVNSGYSTASTDSGGPWI